MKKKPKKKALKVDVRGIAKSSKSYRVQKGGGKIKRPEFVVERGLRLW